MSYRSTTRVPGGLGSLTEGVDYYAPGGTDIPVADGGTGASTAAAARANLGLGEDASPTFAGQAIVNPTTANGLEVDQNGNVGTNVATDGAVHIENTGNTGIGLAVYSNIDSSASAPLVSVRTDNSSFDQDAVQIENDGSGCGLYIQQNGSLGSGKRALHVRNVGTSTTARPLVELQHQSPSTTDTILYVNHAGTSVGDGMSILMQGTGRAILVDHNGNGTAFIIDHDDSGTGYDLDIDRDGNNAATIAGLRVEVTNAGAGAARAALFSTGGNASSARSGVDIQTSLGLRVATKTATFIPADEVVHLVDCSSGPVTVNLPAASGCAGRYYVFKKIDASANAMTIDGNGSETIDGATTQSTTTQYDSFTLACNGTSWFIL